MVEPGTAGRIIALVGAESTGKSTLARALADTLPGLTGLSTTWVPEVLREWCDAAGRTPRRDEQAGIAAEQARRIEDAARRHDVVVADTTPLMTAVYHHQVFGDDGLDDLAVEWQRHCHLTLLTALDLPWQADGLQRDGPHVRVPVDSRIRHLLLRAGLPFTVIGGTGERRLQAALDAISPALLTPAGGTEGLLSRLLARDAAQPAWRWACNDCNDPDCEHLSRQRAG